MRRKTPPDTKVFHYVNANPRGNRAADCTVRSIALATGRSWDEVYDELCSIGRASKHMPNERHTLDEWFSRHGWTRHPQPRHDDNTRLTGAEFARSFDGERCILNIGAEHQSVLIDGRICDEWDCSGRRVGVYWTPPRLG